MENCSFLSRVRTNIATAFFASLERCSCINLSTKEADDSATAGTVALNDHHANAVEVSSSRDRHRSTFNSSPTSSNHDHSTTIPVSSTV